VPDGVDDKFYERADAHIHLSNEQLEDIDRVRASASMMYATARFNAWVSARGVGTKEEMAASREETPSSTTPHGPLAAIPVRSPVCSTSTRTRLPRR